MDHRAVLQLLATLGEGLTVPPGASLVVRHPGASSAHPPVLSSAASSQTSTCRTESPVGVLWRASFALPLEAVEYPQAIFSLVADGRMAIALPAPMLMAAGPGVGRHGVRFSGARVRRHLVALGVGFAVSAAPGSAVAVASAGAVKHAVPGPTPLASALTPDSPTATTPNATGPTGRPTDAAPTSTQTTTNPPVTASGPDEGTPAPPTDGNRPDPFKTTRRHHHHDRRGGTATQPLGTQPPPGTKHRFRLRVNHHKSAIHHHHAWSATHHHHAWSATHHHRAWSVTHRHTNSDPTPSRDDSSVSAAPAAIIASQPTVPMGPANTAGAGDPAALAGWLGLPSASSAWPEGLNPDAFANAALGQSSSPLATDQPPAPLIPIYKAAAKRYQVPWQILAAINWIETGYGSNLNISSAGAMGWMQFMPSTWQEYAVTADGKGQPNPYNPSDAIFTAARYLAANGAAQNLPKAIFAYNHAAWYVAEVIWRAQLITDHSGASNDRSLAGTGHTGLAGAETMLVAAFSAVGGPYSQANHDSFGQSAADLRRAGTDCSGFVSWVLDQVDPGFGNQTTVTLPDQSGIQPGVGQFVTMWDRPLPGDQGHVIINILGTWFESGGNTAYNPAGGIGPISEAGAVGELTGGGFLPYHLKEL